MCDEVEVEERIAPGEKGWERVVRVSGVPEGMRPRLVVGFGPIAGVVRERNALRRATGAVVVRLVGSADFAPGPGLSPSWRMPLRRREDGSFAGGLRLEVTPGR